MKCDRLIVLEQNFSTARTQKLTSYSYDALDNLTQVSQGVQARTFVYDSLKGLTSATNPESGTISYQYDNNGSLTQKTDARGWVTTLGYDALNRVVTTTYANDGGLTPPVSFYYNNASLPAGAPTFDRGSSLGRLVAVTYAAAAAPALIADTIRWAE